MWIPYDENIMARAAKDKKPLIMDFSADWCKPCKKMDKHIFSDPEVVELSRNFITMRLDLTRKQPFQEEVRRRYNVWGVPTVVFLNGEGAEEKRLRIEGLVEKSEFLEKMRWLLEKSTTSRILNSEATDLSMTVLTSHPLSSHYNFLFQKILS